MPFLNLRDKGLNTSVCVSLSLLTFIPSVGFIALRCFLIKLPLQQFLNTNHYKDLKHYCCPQPVNWYKEFICAGHTLKWQTTLSSRPHTQPDTLSLCPACLHLLLFLIFMYLLGSLLILVCVCVFDSFATVGQGKRKRFGEECRPGGTGCSKPGGCRLLWRRCNVRSFLFGMKIKAFFWLFPTPLCLFECFVKFLTLK